MPDAKNDLVGRMIASSYYVYAKTYSFTVDFWLSSDKDEMSTYRYMGIVKMNTLDEILQLNGNHWKK